jgi:uncharacterized protein with HEPN domain
MLTAVSAIEAAIGGLTFEEFCADDYRCKAVILDLQILGEAARNLPASVQACSPDIPWRNLIDMRNRLAHGYFGIELKIVFDTARLRVPPLAEPIRRLRARLDTES